MKRLPLLTLSMAIALAPHGIRVAAVAPGFINTPILGKDEAMKAALAKQHLHNKLIEPEQVASVVAFLFTDGASAINGSTIPVEDGQMLLGTWQSIVIVDTNVDNPSRKVRLSFLAG